MKRAGIWDFWASRYERLWVQRVSLAPTRALLAAHLASPPPGARLLDVGCGTGQLADVVTGWEYTGADPSPAMIAAARRGRPAARFVVADVLAPAAPAGDFDAVVCAHAFPYMPDQPAALARLAAWVRPGGRLLLAQACTESFYDRLALAVVKLTTSPARYRSVAELRALARPLLGESVEVARIDRHRGVPSLRLLVWRRGGGGAPP